MAEDLTTRSGIIESWNKKSTDGNYQRLTLATLLDIRDELKQLNKDAPEPKDAPKQVAWGEQIMDEEAIKRIIEVLKQYCNPKKEYDGIPPHEIAEKLLKAARGPYGI